MYPWIRDAAAAAAAAAVGFAGSHHHHHHHHQAHLNHGGGGHNNGLLNGNGLGLKGENGYGGPGNVNDCMLALDYAHNKVKHIFCVAHSLCGFQASFFPAPVYGHEMNELFPFVTS